MHNLNSDLKFKNQIKFNSFCLQFDVVKRIKKRIPENKAKRNLDQHAKKVVSDNPGLVDFVIRLVNSVLTLPDGQVKYFEEFNLQKNCEINSAHQKIWGAS